jgi:Electron transfer DM13
MRALPTLRDGGLLIAAPSGGTVPARQPASPCASPGCGGMALLIVHVVRIGSWRNEVVAVGDHRCGTGNGMAGEEGSGTVAGARTRRRTIVLVALAVAALAIGGGVVWFQPQQLVISKKVDEPIPAAAEGTPGAGTGGSGSTALPERMAGREPATLVAGSFRSPGHATSGRAVALRLSDGGRVLRLADLHTSNGPDLFVYLSAAAVDAPRDSFDDDFVALGRLKGNQGDQNYQIPAGVDLTRYSTAVIWCRRFTYAFGAAPLR